MERIGLLIAGERREARSGGVLESVGPSSATTG